MGSSGKPPPDYSLFGSLFGSKNSPYTHNSPYTQQMATYQSTLQQMQALRSQQNSIDQLTCFGKPLWMWVAWAGAVGFTPSPEDKTLIDMLTRLDRLTAEESDKWAAFVAAQRVMGRDIW